MFKYDICIVGGLGRVGLPLAVAFADKNLNVVIYDLDKTRAEIVKKGEMPFLEEGCEEKLSQVVNKNLIIADSPAVISQSQYVIVVIGTPVDEHLNPLYSAMLDFFNNLLPHLVAGQYIILRSTVFPGTADKINEFLIKNKVNVHLAFCPERIVEGKALAELESLPQIVSAFDPESEKAMVELFHHLTADIVVVKPIEAELAKLYTNTWRYIQFAVANQFYILADQYKLDYYNIFKAMTFHYPRTQGLPGPGFAAGPCLYKDTMQLASFSNNQFFLGHSAMLINEGLPNYIVQRLKAEIDLRQKNVGILGMAFKANSDDERESLSFKLKRILEIEAGRVYCSDVYVKRDYFISAEDLISNSDIIIIATTHKEYKNLNIGKDKKVVDIWNFYGNGGLI
jgi:UDP-N-acetyl-D-mannosaminuronic acid dehydrogenase